MNEPGLDNRHRNKAAPKKGRIELKHGNTLNKNLPRPIKEFSPLAKVETMRAETGKQGIAAIRTAARNRKKK